MKTIQRKDISGDSISSLPSTYRGVIFRSRMEARWAAYFDILGICWIYEPDGICLPSGNYCPDFRISIYPMDQTAWRYAEIKPTSEAADFIAVKLRDLSSMIDEEVFCLIGNPQEMRQHRSVEHFYEKYAEGAFSWRAFVHKRWGTLDFCGDYEDERDKKCFDLLNRMRFENGACNQDFRLIAAKNQILTPQ